MNDFILHGEIFGPKASLQIPKKVKKINIEYFMESARVRCLHTSCGVSEIEQVSEANE